MPTGLNSSQLPQAAAWQFQALASFDDLFIVFLSGRSEQVLWPCLKHAALSPRGLRQHFFDAPAASSIGSIGARPFTDPQCSRGAKRVELGTSKQTVGEFHVNIREIFVNGGTPIAGWFQRENPKHEWMIWGYPYLWKAHMNISTLGCKAGDGGYPQVWALGVHVPLGTAKWPRNSWRIWASQQLVRENSRIPPLQIHYTFTSHDAIMGLTCAVLILRDLQFLEQGAIEGPSCVFTDYI